MNDTKINIYHHYIPAYYDTDCDCSLTIACKEADIDRRDIIIYALRSIEGFDVEVRFEIRDCPPNAKITGAEASGASPCWAESEGGKK